ncbi:MAG TPA: ABC transporter ATP-binding protein [Chloroflexi bacterium]|nr:ABC transporter ATP-binding protein [Chloroflexota bacterium]
MSLVVETKNLSKHYNGFKAVEDLNLRISEGEIYGFLGPNGAGKTTTTLMLLGLTEPTSGEVRVKGYNSTKEPQRVKRVTAYLPENVGFYEDLSAKRNLRYIAQLNGIPDRESDGKIDNALDKVGLKEVTDWEVRKFSKGMKQRLGMATVLIKEPVLAILDEPTAGIDPEGARQILDLITKMSHEQGMTVLLASHLLYQVRQICDRVGIISRGRLVAEGTIDKLGAEVLGGKTILDVRVSQPSNELVESVNRMEGVSEVELSGNLLRIKANRDIRGAVSEAVMKSGSTLLELKGQEYSLEEIYLKYFHGE